MDEIRWAFANDLVDEQHIDLDWIEERLAQGEDAVLTWLREDHHHHCVDDTIAEMEWWACFDPFPDKVGRNDPCPCGSGLKVKHCCLRAP